MMYQNDDVYKNWFQTILILYPQENVTIVHIYKIKKIESFSINGHVIL